MNGHWLAMRFQGEVVPYFIAYRNCILDDILPTFETIDQRADQLADKTFARHVSKNATEDDSGDLGAAAEAAEGAGQELYMMLHSLRQGTLNLYAVGLHHALEQQLFLMSSDKGFWPPPPNDSKLQILKVWYRESVGIDFSDFGAWPDITELTLLANAIKHGAGRSAARLFVVGRKYFENPWLEPLGHADDAATPLTDEVPLAGEGIYVRKEHFRELANSVVDFVKWIQELLSDWGPKQLPMH